MKTPDSEPPAGDDAWDDLFRQRLADYTDQPQADALDRILAVANPPRPFRYRLLVGAVALLLLLGVGSWFALRSSSDSDPPSAVAANRQPLRSGPSVTATRRPVDQRSSAQPVHGGESIRESATHSVADIADRPTNPELPANRGQSVADAISDRQIATRAADRATRAGAISSANLRRTGLAIRTERAATLPPTAINPASDRIDKQTRSGVYPPNRAGYAVLPGYSITRTIGQNGPPVPVSAYDYRTPARQPAVPDASMPAITTQHFDLMAGRPFRVVNVVYQLPAVSVVMGASTASQAPEASRQQRKPAWFVSLTPLYNFQQIDPIHTDQEFVSNIQGARPLDTDRLSGRLQLGLEWSLTRRLSLRTSLVYQQMRQSLRYAVRSTRPDSVQVVQIDEQTVQVTPHFTERTHAESTVWQYVGLSSDLVWQLNRGGQWQHYLTAGLTAGRYLGAQHAVSGFGQVSYGFERPLTTTVRLRIEPSVQLGWQALTDQAHRLQSRPYSYGLLLGLRFR